MPGSALAAGKFNAPKGQAEVKRLVNGPVTVASLCAGVSDATTDRQVLLIIMQQLAILESKMERLQGEAESQRKQLTFQQGKADVDSKILLASFVSLLVYFQCLILFVL
jgi:hypothetical protein